MMLRERSDGRMADKNLSILKRRKKPFNNEWEKTNSWKKFHSIFLQKTRDESRVQIVIEVESFFSCMRISRISRMVTLTGNSFLA